MSKALKANNPASCPGEGPPFEEALKKLESIVETMEGDESAAGGRCWHTFRGGRHAVGADLPGQARRSGSENPTIGKECRWRDGVKAAGRYGVRED